MLTLLDAKLPFLETALNIQQAQEQLCTFSSPMRAVKAATLIRHKPGRRALIRYDIETDNGPLTLLGKIRAKGADYAAYTLQKSLWNKGFGADSPDGFSVPEPLGIIPDWKMWLQRYVPGVPATEVLPSNRGTSISSQIANLAHKLHQASIPTTKKHTLADELSILHQRLPQVCEQYPHWQRRIDQILADCDVLADQLSLALDAGPRAIVPTVGIHRDFYSDQILVDGNRLWLVDLDLYCQGNPALDIGNFIAHMTEQSLRHLGNPTAMVEQEIALREAFIETFCRSSSTPKCSAAVLGVAIDAYTLLTLVRHIHISTQIPARRPFTALILALCEARLQQMI